MKFIPASSASQSERTVPVPEKAFQVQSTDRAFFANVDDAGEGTSRFGARSLWFFRLDLASRTPDAGVWKDIDRCKSFVV